jgi:hypothetical protein
MKKNFIRVYMLFLALFIFSHEKIIAQTGNWKLAGNNNLTGTEKLGSKNNIDLNLVTNNTTRMTITANGRVGIGASLPESDLHIFRGSAGTVTANSNSLLVLENNTHNYISLLTPSASEKGILFGDDLTPADGGVLYNSSNAMLFRTNGNVTRMSLTGTGNLGVGTTTPARKLQVQDGDIRISRAASEARFLEFISTVTNQNDARMEYSSAGSFFYFSRSADNFTSFNDLARFDLATSPTFAFTVFGSALASGGTWTNSDLRLKKDINDVNNAMDIIRQLKPRTYFYKKDEYKSMNFSSAKQYGFVAQELEKILPELVQVSQQPVRINAQGEREMEEVKSVNYNELIPILTKAIQEQEQKINAQDKKIEELTRLVEQRLTTSTMLNTNVAPTLVDNASLEQNIPNPFNKTTTIKYSLPQKFTSAQILISDKNGKPMKQVNVSGSGKGIVNIDAGTLSGGAYNYSLIVDGKIINTKQMLLAK